MGALATTVQTTLAAQVVSAIYSRGVFDPIKLFSADEEGTFLDFTTTQVYADTAGTDPAEVGEGIALTLDKSQGANILRRNLLAYTEEFDNAAWSKSGAVVVANSVISPDGATTADSLAATAVASSHFILYNPGTFLAFSANSVAFSFYAKANGESVFAIREQSVTGAQAAYTLTGEGSTFAVTAGSADATTAGITNVGDGWYRCSLQISKTGATTWKDFRLFVIDSGYLSGVLNTYTWTGDGTSGIYIWGAQLDLGSTATEYQKITTGINGEWTPGTHSTQATSAARPIFGRVPVGGRRNLLTFSEDGISKYTSVSNVVDGSLPGFDTALVYGDNSVTRAAYKLTSVVGGQEYTSSAYIQMDDGGAPTTADFNFFSSGGLPVPTITLVSGSLYRVSSSRVPPSTSNTVSGFQKTTGQSARTFKTSGIMHELGSTPTPYQKVVTQHDITEAGIPSIYKAFFDKADDILPVTLPTITGGTVALVGTSGIWIEEDWGFTAGTLSIGPTTIAGLPAGILSVVGDLCAVIINDRAWTAAEYAEVVSWGKARGAPGVFSLGEELVTNGAFSDGATGWISGLSTWAVVDNEAVIETANGSVQQLTQLTSAMSGSLVVNQLYEISFSTVVTTGSLFIRFGSGAFASQIPVTINTSGSYTLKAAWPSGGDRLVIHAGGDFTGTIDNISVRELELIP
jgi:hypothetical protein